jgi:hypothetical protein
MAIVGAVGGAKGNAGLGCTTDRAGRCISFLTALRLARALRSSRLCLTATGLRRTCRLRFLGPAVKHPAPPGSLLLAPV